MPGGGRDIKVGAVGGPAERGAQIREFGGDPGVGLTLPGTVHRARTSASRPAK